MTCPHNSSFNRQADIQYVTRSIALIRDFTQAWAQATRVDCSLIVIHSGNHEFIGVRNRSDQSLYISDLVKPHAFKAPSYGKLHVGLFIAAIEDAIDRERQVHDARQLDGDNGPPGDGGDDEDPYGDDPHDADDPGDDDASDDEDDILDSEKDDGMGRKEGSRGAEGAGEWGDKKGRGVKSLAKGCTIVSSEMARKVGSN
jgi:hypothetical protein